MTRMYFALVVVAMLPAAALPCTICGQNATDRPTVRQEASDARVIVVGKLGNPRLNADGTGTTELTIERIVKDHAILKGKTVLTVGRYLPVDEKSPKFLLLCDVAQGKLDVLTGRFVKEEKYFDYVKAVLELDPKDRAKALQFYFRHLDSDVPTIAADAWLEFAKATDAEVGRVAPQLDPQRIRQLLKSEATPPERIGLFAFLLGACGNDKDADLLLDLVRKDSEQTRMALSGLLSGYTAMRPKDGWKLIAGIVRDSKRKFLDRYAALAALRFLQTWKPADHRAEKQKVLAEAVEHGDIADVAIEDLRRWQWWDLTQAVLAKYGKKSHDSPLVQRSILRYALVCPQQMARDFIAERTRKEPGLIADIKESLLDP